VKAGGYGRRSVVIRVNGLDSVWRMDDLAVACAAEPDAILIPKFSTAEDMKHRDTSEALMCALNYFMEKQVAERLNILRVDIAFVETNRLSIFVESALRTAWPEYILCNHANTDISGQNSEKLFSLTQYTVEAKFKNNTLLRRCN
jgi:hypothetical protein